MVCGAKRIRSLYLPSMTGVTPKLSTTIPPKGLASLFTINAATMRLCRADLPAAAHPSRLACPGLAAGRSLPQSSSSPSPQLGEKDGHIRGRSRWFVHNAGYWVREQCGETETLCGFPTFAMALVEVETGKLCAGQIPGARHPEISRPRRATGWRRLRIQLLSDFAAVGLSHLHAAP